MNEEQDGYDDVGRPEALEKNLPVEGRGSRNAPIARQPMEQIAGAMQVQAELLKQMHERQRMLEDVVKDNRRHELMINSAQALNESFQGLQRVQERLADQLEGTSGASRGRFVIIAVAIVLLAGLGGFLTWRLVDSADAINSNLKSAMNPRARDLEMQEGLSKLESRLRSVEEIDRATLRDEIDKLRKLADANTQELEQNRRERDTAREELGAAKATLGTVQTELADMKGKSQALEKDNARLTAQGVADQKTILQLNDLVATVKDSKTPPGPPKPPIDAEAARKANAPPELSAPERANASPAPGVQDAARAEADVTSAGDAPVPFPAAQIEPLNALLKSHRGSDRYALKTVEKSGQKKLWNVVMEVKSPDGTLNKTIESENLTFWLKGDLLEIEFERGSVTFHQSLGKSTKSPFFNNRYVIVVLGTNGKEWLAANQPFIRTK